MKLLTVPNWSFGRDRGLRNRFREILDSLDLTVHFAESDVDHNRTVTAFTGEPNEVFRALFSLAEEGLPCIDLNRHVGVHPRIGALDVCPFILYDQKDFEEANQLVEHFGKALSDHFRIPVFLYERSERGRHESDLPSLRKGGFGGLADRVLTPDFGPSSYHPQWGVAVMGIRGFLIAVNVNLRSTNMTVARQIASEMRKGRSDGNELFLGVRSLGFPLVSRDLTQVSLNLTLPDITSVDPILEWVRLRAEALGEQVDSFELIGVIRQSDRISASLLPIHKSQIVNM